MHSSAGFFIIVVFFSKLVFFLHLQMLLFRTEVYLFCSTPYLLHMPHSCSSLEYLSMSSCTDIGIDACIALYYSWPVLDAHNT